MALKICIGGGFLLLAGTSYWLYPAEFLASDSSRSFTPAAAVRPTPQTETLPTSAQGKPSDLQPITPRAPLKPVKVNSSDALLENWDLGGTELTKKDLAPFFTDSQPESIVYFTAEGVQQIYPKKYEIGEKQSQQTLFIGTEESVRQTQAERAQRAGLGLRGGEGPARRQAGLRKLPGNAFGITAFIPGKRDNGDTLKPVVTDLLAALQGPDYSMADYNPKDKNEVQRHLETVLSLGHGGEIKLHVSDGGFLLDEPGFDFAIFQTTFRIGRSKFFWHKFARVGVSDSEQESSFRWFDCDPDAKIIRGCAGAVPTTEGGDQFDLSEVGLKHAQFIWIKDTGTNKNISSDSPTEGISLDALRLDHAYTRN